MFTGDIKQLKAQRGFWERIEHQFPFKLLPSEGVFLTASVEPFEQGLDAGEVELKDCVSAEGDGVVVVVSAKLSDGSLPEFSNGETISRIFDPVGEVLDSTPESFWRSSDFKGASGDCSSAPVEDEANKTYYGPCFRSELDHSALTLVELKLILGEPLCECCFEVFSDLQIVEDKHRVSSPQELPPQALAELDVILSHHTAPITEPATQGPTANAQGDWVRVGECSQASIVPVVDGT